MYCANRGSLMLYFNSIGSASALLLVIEVWLFVVWNWESEFVDSVVTSTRRCYCLREYDGVELIIPMT